MLGELCISVNLHQRCEKLGLQTDSPVRAETAPTNKLGPS